MTRSNQWHAGGIEANGGVLEMGRTRIRAYDALTFLLACSVVALFVRSTLQAPGTVQFDRPALGSLLWPGAFQVSTNAPATRVDFVARARHYAASVASDAFRLSTPGSAHRRQLACR